jgi:hypothetical protein
MGIAPHFTMINCRKLSPRQYFQMHIGFGRGF